MTQYTTGELAKRCGVSVRTVQYYDSRGIVMPSALSEGGRRLYSQEDLKRMQIVCFLRQMDFSLEQIGELFSQAEPEKTISLLIQQQEESLLQQLREDQQRLDKLTGLKRSLKDIEVFSIDSLGDIAYMLENRKKRRNMLLWVTALGLLMDGIEIAALVCGIATGNWGLCILGCPLVLALGIWDSCIYFGHAAYICPECHEVFHPRFRESLWAAHTPNTRRLRCPRCSRRSFCVEVYRPRPRERGRLRPARDIP